MVPQNHNLNHADQPPYHPLIPPLIPPLTPTHEETAQTLAPQPTIYLEREIIWEYKIVDYRNDDAAALTNEMLDRYGAQGWELSGTLSLNESIRFFFKRLQRS